MTITKASYKMPYRHGIVASPRSVQYRPQRSSAKCYTLSCCFSQGVLYTEPVLCYRENFVYFCLFQKDKQTLLSFLKAGQYYCKKNARKLYERLLNYNFNTCSVQAYKVRQRELQCSRLVPELNG